MKKAAESATAPAANAKPNGVEPVLALVCPPGAETSAVAPPLKKT